MGEGIAKLVLGPIPEGGHAPKEVAHSLGLWQTRHYEDLLRRVEMQASQSKFGNRRKGKRKLADGDEEVSAIIQAIRKMIAEGAYRKATMAMLEQGDVVSGEECIRWAEELHPRSTKPERVFHTPPPAS